MSFSNRRQPRGKGEQLIIKRRQRENEVAYYSRNVNYMKTVTSRAEWEDKIRNEANEKQIQNTVKVLLNQEDENLHNRRCKLANLYNYEIKLWKDKIINNMETPEQRKQAMIKRAKALKEKREAERLKLVNEKRMQQYRESCDNLRLLDSKRSVLIATEERSKQLHDKQLELSREIEYEKQMAILWEKDRQKKIERENNDRRKAIERNNEVKKILDIQVNINKKNKNDETIMKKKEDQELLRKWAIQGKEESEKERKLKVDAILRAAEVKKFNRQRESIRHEDALKERQYDLKLLELALKREADADAKDKALQEQFKNDAIEYQEMLKKQMAIEAEDLSYLDEIRRKMEEEVWNKRDAVHRAEAEAREELLKNVLKSRENEIERKRQLKIKQLHDDQEFMKIWKQEAEKELLNEKQDERNRLLKSKNHQTLLKKQINLKKQIIQQDKQDEYLELKRMQLAEKHHQELVEKMFQETNIKAIKNNRRKTAEWYFNC